MRQHVKSKYRAGTGESNRQSPINPAQAETHLAMVADDGVRMAAMLIIKRVFRQDFNWATAGTNLYLVFECGPELQQCPPFYRRPSRPAIGKSERGRGAVRIRSRDAQFRRPLPLVGSAVHWQIDFLSALPRCRTCCFTPNICSSLP